MVAWTTTSQPLIGWNSQDYVPKKGFHKWTPNLIGLSAPRVAALAHQNRTIAIASGFRVDGAKSPEIPQKEEVLGSEIAAQNRRSLVTFHRTLKSQCIIAVSCLGNRAISGVRDGHRNRKSQESLRFRCAKVAAVKRKLYLVHCGECRGLFVILFCCAILTGNWRTKICEQKSPKFCSIFADFLQKIARTSLWGIAGTTFNEHLRLLSSLWQEARGESTCRTRRFSLLCQSTHPHRSNEMGHTAHVHTNQRSKATPCEFPSLFFFKLGCQERRKGGFIVNEKSARSFMHIIFLRPARVMDVRAFGPRTSAQKFKKKKKSCVRAMGWKFLGWDVRPHIRRISRPKLYV